MNENTERLKNAARKQAEMRASGELVVSYNPAQKLAAGRKTTRKLAIDAQCWHCMGGTAHEWDSDCRRNIRQCTASPGSSMPCALWEWRPYK